MARSVRPGRTAQSARSRSGATVGPGYDQHLIQSNTLPPPKDGDRSVDLFSSTAGPPAKHSALGAAELDLQEFPTNPARTLAVDEGSRNTANYAGAYSGVEAI